MATIQSTITLRDDMSAKLNHIEASIDSVVGHMENLDNAMQSTGSGGARGMQAASTATDGLINKLKQLAAAYISVKSAQAIIDTSDAMTSMNARLAMVQQAFGNASESAEQFRNKIFAAANDSRGSYESMAALIARIGMNARDAFSNTDELIKFADIVQKDAVIGGASAQEAANAEIQLSQAMASGVLRGQDFRSVMEQMPTIVGQIADYLDVSRGKVKELADKGQLSAEVVKNAILSAADSVDAAYQKMPMTFGQAVTQIKNTALQAFEPVLAKINSMLNSEQGQAILSGIENSLYVIANVASAAIDGLSGLMDVLYALSPAIIGVATAIAVYNAMKLAQAAATAIATAAQTAENSAMLASPVFWITAIIVALIVVIYEAAQAFAETGGAASTAFGVIVGVIYEGIAAIQNFGLLVGNIAMAIAAFFTACGKSIMNSFSVSIAQVKMYFYSLLSTAVSVISSIASSLNALPFVNIDTAGLNKAAQAYADKAKANQKIVDNGAKGYDPFAAASKAMDTFQYKSYQDAYNKGAKVGDAFSNKLTSKFTMPKAASAGLSGIGSVASNTGKTAGNTGKIKDKLDDTQEDLQYLCDIAERDAVNRFTTASISVDMVNNNSISSGLDLDGIVDGLASRLKTSMASVAEGA